MCCAHIIVDVFASCAIRAFGFAIRDLEFCCDPESCISKSRNLEFEPCPVFVESGLIPCLLLNTIQEHWFAFEFRQRRRPDFFLYFARLS